MTSLHTMTEHRYSYAIQVRFNSTPRTSPQLKSQLVCPVLLVPSLRGSPTGEKTGYVGLWSLKQELEERRRMALSSSRKLGKMNINATHRIRCAEARCCDWETGRRVVVAHLCVDGCRARQLKVATRIFDCCVFSYLLEMARQTRRIGLYKLKQSQLVATCRDMAPPNAA
jgi:hypothetical protein